MKVPPRVLLSGVFKKHLSSMFRLLQLPCISLKNIHLKCHCALVEQIQNKSSLDGVWKWAKRFRERGTCLYWFAACLSSASSHGSVKWSCKVDAWVIITYQLQSTIILFFLPFFFFLDEGCFEAFHTVTCYVFHREKVVLYEIQTVWVKRDNPMCEYDWPLSALLYHILSYHPLSLPWWTALVSRTYSWVKASLTETHGTCYVLTVPHAFIFGLSILSNPTERISVWSLLYKEEIISGTRF